MRILLLDLGCQWRGGQRQVLYLARHLSRSRDFSVLVAAPGNAPLLERCAEGALPTMALPGRRDFDPRNLWALARAVRVHSIDLIHTQDARSASLAALYRLLSRRRPVLVHSRRVSYPLGTGWSRAKYARADLVVAVSEEVRGVLEASGLDPARLAVVHSGIDPARYRVAAREDAPELVFGAMGAMSPQKGFAVFLDALALLRDMDLPPWRALAVGDGELRQGLESRARELGLAGRVTFTGYKESWQALLDMDVLAVPSMDGEGSNAVVKEGWAARVPVVVSDLAANLELVEPGVSGLSFPRGDAGALAQALARAAQDADLRRALAAKGHGRVALFTDAAMARGIMDCYRRLAGRLDGSSPPRR